MVREEKNALNGVTVSQAMRRQVNKLSTNNSISNSINLLIKHKINGILTTSEDGLPAGVISKTDIIGSFYAGLPIDLELENIMSSPPLFCKADDPLENALEMMRNKGVYRLYVTEAKEDNVVGALAYPDIVGMLYKYCYYCDYSRLGHNRRSQTDEIDRMRVKEVMTEEVKAVFEDDPLTHVMEVLSMYRMGALLVHDFSGAPIGVISKTDLVLAYKHGIDSSVPAKTIMTRPVRSCGANEFLEDALKKMIFSDIHRLFVHREGYPEIAGVFSLSDAARNRSGSCQACISSRITMDP